MSSKKKSDSGAESTEPAYDFFGQAGPQPDTEAALQEHIEMVELSGRELNEEERKIRAKLQKDRETRDKRIFSLKQARRTAPEARKA